MPRDLAISLGQHSDRGRKPVNQDFHGAVIPAEPALGLKGIAVALADGISSSEVGRVAAESAVKSFLTDYYCTPDAWSVKTSAQRVIAAANSWLHAETRRSIHAYDRDKGYVCTLSVMVLKSLTAHIFHIGDARVCRVVGDTLDQLTDDHRVVVSSEQVYLGRALGMSPQIEIDYRTVALELGDIFVLATDGVAEHVGAKFIVGAIRDHAADLDRAARAITEEALRRGSPDNLTVQIVRIDQLPDGDAAAVVGQDSDLPMPPLLEPRMEFDGFRIVRQLHASHRSHIYLAVDTDDDRMVALKIPSIDLRDDPAYVRRFKLEEWVARRLNSPHVLKPSPPARRRGFLYVVNEFIDGQTLTQWMRDNERPALETVRGLVVQIARGLQAFHRKEMLHQDLRPDNIMIDRTGTVKIIDFGATRVAGVAEAAPSAHAGEILGTQAYAAPEYFLGEAPTTASDIYSLGVITYQMLTGRLPYGAEMAKATTRAAQSRVRYRSARDDDHPVPDWIDGALRKAVQFDPRRRYAELSEFVHDLHHPNKAFADQPTPLIERNPLLFWKALSFLLACALLVTLIVQHGGR
ncbi:MAG: protein kinase [Xanthobacteraceae bacterium]|nr:protein kinase [Xanthobacteraceae bacterium]